MERTLGLTSPNLKGDDVEYAQRLLKKHQYYPGKVDGEYGEASAQASKRAKYRLGYEDKKLTDAGGGRNFDTPLEKYLLGQAQPTGAMVARAKKRAATQVRPLRLKALERMVTYIGTVEQPAGSNHVPGFTDWWGWGNVAWCAITVSKAYIEAGAQGFRRGSSYAYVPTLVAHARQGVNGLSVTTNPMAGDLVCFDWDGSNFAAGNNHVGMFETGTPGKFQTIEGNWSQRCDRVKRTGGSAPRIVFIRASR